MTRPAVVAAVAVCRIVLGEVSDDMADALAAAEAWAAGEEPQGGEYWSLYRKARTPDELGEAACWVLTAGFVTDPREAEYCIEQALATLAALPGWDDASVQALYAAQAAPRDTVPAPAPEFQEAA